ncbi:uncharacterized protein LOC118403009 [Branchiostoma floridae]|uniref:Uncharacterized protein LOC118403009 n=1 Tax=Branchiostoma floridae TaxID=7739 RepID=A0A9J7KF66_BRAFL|nr:uncharacterized protein LOC118403009 [Branchiostoma floridae]
MEEKDSSTVGAEGEEKNEDLQKRVPKKAEWQIIEEKRRKKVFRSSVLGKLTSKANAIKSWMESPENKWYVQGELTLWRETYEELKEAHREYQLTLSPEQAEEDNKQWAADKFESAEIFYHEVERWMDISTDHTEPLGADGLSLTVKPSDSVSHTGSLGRRSVQSRTSTASRVDSEIKRLELMVQATALQERLALERKSLEIEQEKQLLAIRTEISVEDAKIKMFKDMEEQELRGDKHGGEEHPKWRSPVLDPNILSYVPRQVKQEEQGHSALWTVTDKTRQKREYSNSERRDHNLGYSALRMPSGRTLYQPPVRTPQQPPNATNDMLQTSTTLPPEPKQNISVSKGLPQHVDNVVSQQRSEQGNTVTTTPEEFLQGLVSAQAEVTKLMVEHNKQASLPTRAISVFDGDPLKYTTFVRAFKHAIEDKTSDAEDRLSYLQQYTRGEAKKIVDSCFLMDPEEGFRKAKESLQERYGTPHKISRAYSMQVSKWPEIKAEDKAALKNFVLFLMECKNAMSGDRYLRELDHYSNIKLLVDKLPFKLRERWRRHSHGIVKERSVTFSDFAAFVQKEEDVVSNEVFGDLNNREKSQSSGFKQKHGPRRGSSLAVAMATDSAETESTGGCLYCAKPNHYLSDCRVLGAKPMDERLRYIKGQGLCFGCLKATTHMARDCRQRAECKRCQKSHPTVLHRDAGTVPKKTAAVGRVLRTGCSWEGVPPIIPVKVRSKTTNITVETYAFLDSGSDVVFCTEALKDQLKTSGRKTKLKLNTINDTKAVQSEVLHDLEVMDLKGENTIPIATAYTQKKIPASKTNIITTKDLTAWPYLNEVDVPQIDAEIGLLIGNNVPKAVEPWQVVHSQGGGPYAIRTVLGWSVNGPLKGASDDKANVNRISLDQQLTEYFNNDFNETKDDKKEMSVEDQRFMKIVSEGTKKEDGHYQIPLPFRNSPPELPNNKQVALQRANHLRRKMTKNGSFQEEYTLFMQKIIEKGYAERVPTEQLKIESGRVWYVPHHGVYHPQKGKMRVVFDCAASYAGTSLNKELLQGPDLTSTLFGVLTRFRQEPVALMADIEAMFSQVKVPSEDRDYQRFMWWPEGQINKPLEEYRMTVHVFGATSSPSCANYALKRLADDCKDQYDEEVLKAIKGDFYVDDLLKSTETVEKGQCLAEDIRSVCGTGGFRLTKWISNYQQVIKAVPVTERAEEVKNLDLKYNSMPTERALGMLWNVQTDTLGYRTLSTEKPATRRGILSVVSSFYDPLGMVAPALLPPKMILQDLCKESLGWDDEIPEKHFNAWQEWESDLQLLSSKFEVDRCLKPRGFGTPTSVQLHHFADASEVGYGTASYVRMENQEGKVHCTLLVGKSRVTPLKKITIPRLELNAAVVAVRVDSMLKRELDLKVDRTHFWTDSTTVLKYINNETSRFHTFVANRLATIRQVSSPRQWRYVESGLNPADDASRGQPIQDFIENERWLKGPQFLWQEESRWPSQPDIIRVNEPQLDPEIKVHAIVAQEVEQENPVDKLLRHYSSWHRLKKAIAWLVKVRQALLTKKKPLSPTCYDLEQAELIVIKHVQMKYKEEGMSSTVKKLDPKLDAKGILRVGGRLGRSTLPVETKHPILLPKKSRAAELMLQELHSNVGHMGREYVIALARKRYWIPKINSLVRKVISKCVVCRRQRGKPGEQKMADLPSHRVTPDEPPFTRVGVDYFGPIEVKRGRSTVKRYGVIFTCMATRAVHIEKADSLDTDSCISALRRFVARRGQAKQIWSDNGTNLVGAKAEMEKEIKKWNERQISETMLKKNVDWRFNPPTGSHFGGVWERQIRSIRQVLNAISKQKLQDDEGLRTLFCEVEYIINGRPITAVSMDINDVEALTPNHLLTMRSGPSLPPSLTDKSDLYAKRRWKQVQYLADQFWKRWTREYLTALQERQKWGKVRRNFAVGDIVIMKDDQTPRGAWPRGKIVQVMPDRRGLVRRVQVKTQRNILERPIDKLVCILPEDEQP